MIALLSLIAQGVLDIGAFFAFGAIESVNLVFAAMTLAGAAAVALLPAMPVVGTFAPELLAELNWWYPFGAISSLLTSAVAMYVGWLAVRYLLRLVRAA